MARATPTPAPEPGDENDAVEGTAEEVGTDLIHPAASGIIVAAQPEEILAKAAAIATPLKKLIEDQNLSKNVGGKKKHVEVGGWQALGTLLGALGGEALHAETVWSRPARDPDGGVLRHTYTVKKTNKDGVTTEFTVDGHDWEARVEIRTISGRVVGSAEALCSRTEETWAQRPDPACKSMAETRAESRAYRRAVGWIISLAGYNPTPAEEMPDNEKAEVEQGPPFGPPASDSLGKKVPAALAFLADTGEGPDETIATKVGVKIGQDTGGYMPSIVARAILHLASEVKAAIDGATTATSATGEAPQAAADPSAAEEPPAEEVTPATDDVTNPPEEEMHYD